MTAAITKNFRFALAISLAAIGGFWFSMEGYQKDRFATVVVRSAIIMVDHVAAPHRPDALQAR